MTPCFGTPTPCFASVRAFRCLSGASCVQLCERVALERSKTLWLPKSVTALGARCRRFESCLPDAQLASPQLAFEPLNPDLAIGHFGVFWCL